MDNSISTKRAILLILAATAIVFGFLLVWMIGRVVLLGFAGLLLALFLQAIAAAVEQRTPLSYRWSCTLVLLAIVLLIVGSVWLTATHLADEASQMVEAVPTSVSELKKSISKYKWGEWVVPRLDNVSEAVKRQGTFTQVTGLAGSALNFFADVAIIVFVGVYLAAEPNFYLRSSLRLLPEQWRPRGREVASALAYNLRWWLFGRIVAMVAIGILMGAGYYFLGLPMAFLLAVIAAVFQIIPSLGPLLAAIPAMLVAWSQGTQTVIYMLVLYSAVQFVESYLLTPLIQRQAARLPPALTLLAMLAFGIVGGVLGLLVAAPMTVAGIVLVTMLYVEGVLGDTSAEVPGE